MPKPLRWTLSPECRAWCAEQGDPIEDIECEVCGHLYMRYERARGKGLKKICDVCQELAEIREDQECTP